MNSPVFFFLPEMKHSESDILRGIRQHDSEILEYVYRVHFPLIESYVLHNSGDREQAKDLFQEGMIVVYRNIRDKKLELQCKFGTYLYAVCKNIWIQERKKYSLRMEKLRQHALEVNDPGPEENPLLEKHAHILFDKHFSKLSEDCQRILSMHFNAYNVEEIRDAMGYKDTHHAADRKYRCKKSLIKRIVNDPLFKKLKNEIR